MRPRAAIAVAAWATLALAGVRAAGAGDQPPPDAPDDGPAAGDGAGTYDPADYLDSLEGADTTSGDAAAVDAAEPPTGTVRVGAYQDSDRTTVWRGLATLARQWQHWHLSGSATVDAVTSASIDVRSSPALSEVDVVTSASGRTSTSGGFMADRRYQVTGGAGWTDGGGRAADLSVAVAREADYLSLSAGVNGSYDVDGRTTTLLGGVTVTDNRVSSVLDRALDERLRVVAWSAGLARVLTRDDAVRVRYDGQRGDGFHASPYRNVRFGDWTAHFGEHQVTFTDTIGSADGLPEHEPAVRVSHALVLEWVHALALGVGLHPQLRASHDSWGLDSLSAGLDLRVARERWRAQLGYRFYLQSRADFFEDKYVEAPEMYTYHTSDKDLGDQRGHLVSASLSRVLVDAERPGDTRLVLDVQLDAIRYQYPGFTLLPERSSLFAGVGIHWEL